MKISDTPPFFLKKKTPPILPTPPYLWEKISKTQPPFIKGHFLKAIKVGE